MFFEIDFFPNIPRVVLVFIFLYTTYKIFFADNILKEDVVNFFTDDEVDDGDDEE